jgi:hypothetical protein
MATDLFGEPLDARSARLNHRRPELLDKRLRNTLEQRG